MSKGLVTVFGGSGFVGRHVVRALVKDGWRVRVPMRRPHTGHELRVIGNVGQVQLVQANIRFMRSVERAVEGSDAVINLVGILFKSGKQSFSAVHAIGARTVAEAAANMGVTNYVHMSAIGASEDDAASDYAQSKGESERLVREIMPTADIMRPSIIFGEGDAFFNRFAAMAQLSPALPLIGGDTKFQPVYVANVAEAIAKVAARGTNGKTYELGGPRVYSFAEMMKFLMTVIDRKRILLPVPWMAANALGFMGEVAGAMPFVKPFLTRDQVKSLKSDNIVADDALSFSDLGIDTETIEAIVPTYMDRYRKYGQFHERTAS